MKLTYIFITSSTPLQEFVRLQFGLPDYRQLLDRMTLNFGLNKWTVHARLKDRLEVSKEFPEQEANQHLKGMIGLFNLPGPEMIEITHSRPGEPSGTLRLTPSITTDRSKPDELKCTFEI